MIHVDTASHETETRISFTEQLDRDAEFNTYWTNLAEKAQETVADGKAKKSKFEAIVEKKEGGTFYANPAHFQIKPGFNFRNLNSAKAIERIKVLAGQIKEDGMQTPIKVFNDGNDPIFWIEDGHRRMTALKYAIVHLDYTPDDLLIPVRMGQRYANDVERKFSQFRDNQGEKTTPFETARIFADMVKMGGKEEEIARKANMSKSRIISLLDMATVPAALQALTEQPDIEIADSFIHALYLKTDRKADIALEALEKAIAYAKDQEYERVMPKHLPEPIKSMYRGEKPAKAPTKQAQKEDAAPEDETPEVEADAAVPTPKKDKATTVEVPATRPEAGTAVDTSTDHEDTDEDEGENETVETEDTKDETVKKDSKKAGTAKADRVVQSEENLNFRKAVEKIFKENIMVSPIDPENPEADRTLSFKKDTITFLTSLALLHNMNL